MTRKKHIKNIEKDLCGVIMNLDFLGLPLPTMNELQENDDE